MDVMLVVRDLVSRVATICEKEAAKKGKKGAASRKSYSYSFRMDVLTNFQENQKGADTISCSNVSINSWPDEMHLK